MLAWEFPLVGRGVSLGGPAFAGFCGFLGFPGVGILADHHLAMASEIIRRVNVFVWRVDGGLLGCSRFLDVLQQWPVVALRCR